MRPSLQKLSEADSSSKQPAGAFSQWLNTFRHAILQHTGSEVPCGDCIDCCSASQFIHVTPEDTGALARIKKNCCHPLRACPKTTASWAMTNKASAR